MTQRVWAVRDPQNPGEEAGRGEGVARTAGPHCYLCFSALKAAADHGVTGSVQHSAQLLAELEGGGAHQAWGLAAEPDEHVGPTVQDVDTARVQQALQLGARAGGQPVLGQRGGSCPLASSLCVSPAASRASAPPWAASYAPLTACS